MTGSITLIAWALVGAAVALPPQARPAAARAGAHVEGEASRTEPGLATPSAPAPAPAPPSAPAGPSTSRRSETPSSPGNGGESGETAPPPSPAGPASPDASGDAPPPSSGGTTEPTSTPEAGTPAIDAPATGPSEGVDDGDLVDDAPAALPPEGPPPPKPHEPRAWGGAFGAPLPPSPEPADPSTIREGPWRGRVWLGVGLAATFPLGGRPPAAGGVIAVAAEADLGVRLNRFLALHTSISSFAHDAAQRTFAVPDGTPVAEVELGRIAAFDLLTARVYAPVHRRIEPWGEVGLGVGSRRAPFATDRQAAGLVRVGAGVDFWLAPTLTLGLSTLYRTIIIGDAVGHGLRAGADFGIHW